MIEMEIYWETKMLLLTEGAKYIQNYIEKERI